MRHSTQQGAAMLMALLVVAILSIVATQVSGTVQFNLQKASNQSQQAQAYWYLLAAEQLVKQQLNASLEEPTTHLQQAWARPDQHYPFERGEVRFEIADEQSCFNINGLAKLRTDENETQLEALEVRQLEALLKGMGYRKNQLNRFTESLLDWLDGDLTPSGTNGAEDLYYSRQPVPYLSGNDLVWRLSELNLLAEPLPEQTQRFDPWLCAPPSSIQAVNINTIARDKTKLLNKMLLDQLSESQLAKVLDSRGKQGFSNVQEFWYQLQLDANEDNPEISGQFTTNSEFFRARILVRVDDTEQLWTSHFHLREGEFRMYSRSMGENL